MSLNRGSVCAKLCLLLLILADRGAQGRPWNPNDQQGGMPPGSVSINTGAAEGGTVNIVVYPWVSKWDYWRDRSEEIEDTKTTSKSTNQGTTTTTAPDVKTTRPHSTTTVGYDPSKIIIAPPIPRECPDGEKPDMSNNCRVEWGDFSKSIGKSQLPVRSTSAPQSTAKPSTVGHHLSNTRKHRQ